MTLIAMMAALAALPAVGWGAPPDVAQAFERKRSVGEAAFGAELDVAAGRARDRQARSGRCPSRTEAEAHARMELVRLTADPAAWSRSHGAAEAALTRREQMREAYLDGVDTSAAYRMVSRMAARAKAEPDPGLAALYRRTAMEQFSRINSVSLRPFLGPGVHTDWEKGLDGAALAYVAAAMETEPCALDRDNAAWLKAEIKARGWYRIPVHGAAADLAAWTIVQHARHDLAFQEEVLALLEPLWATGETRGENYAMLYDQTAVARGLPARFGVVGGCTAPGVWAPGLLEDPAATDGWRAKARMAPLAEQIAVRSRGCID